ncbi:MAG: hypothetical protein ACYS76_13395 [Planctomycetota bacterium]|jgi:hypothetical protein
MSDPRPGIYLDGVEQITPTVPVAGIDSTAIHDNVAGEINAITAATPTSGDKFIFEDASDGFAKKEADFDDLGGGGGGVAVDYACYQDQQPTSTAGGTAGANTDQTRVLNTTEVAPSGSNISRSGNVVTLKDGGRYFWRATAPGNLVNLHQLLVKQTSGTPAFVLMGTPQQAGSSSAGHTIVPVSGEIDLTAAGTDHTYELIHRTSTARATDGLGKASPGSRGSTFATVEIWELA